MSRSDHFLSHLFDILEGRTIPEPGRSALQARYDSETNRLVISPMGTRVPIAKPGTVFIPLPDAYKVWGVQTAKATAFMETIKDRTDRDAVLREALGSWPPRDDLYGDQTHLAKKAWWVGLDGDPPYYTLTDWDGHGVMAEPLVVLATRMPTPREADKYGGKQHVHIPKALRDRKPS